MKVESLTTIVGDYPYVAIELWYDSDDGYYNGVSYSEKTDIYALGGMFYSIITNKDVQEPKVINEDIENEDEEGRSNYFFHHDNIPEYYEYFKELVTDMVSEEIDERPNIYMVITRILLTLPKIIDYVNKTVNSRSKNLMVYLEEEKAKLNTIAYFKEELISDFEKRKLIYSKFMEEQNFAGIKLFDIDEYSDYMNGKILKFYFNIFIFY